MLWKSKEDEYLWIYSMGKKMRVTAITDNDKEANAHMEKTGVREGVIACFGPFVFMANLYDRGEK